MNLLESGHLRLYCLRLGGKIAAALCAFSDGARMCCYLSGFAKPAAPLNPSALLIGHAIEEAICEGCGEFDFLRGRETYKYLWGAKGKLNYRRKLLKMRQTAQRVDESVAAELLMH